MRRVLMPNQCITLLSAADAHGPRARVLIRLLLNCGLRVSELHGLNWSDCFQYGRPRPEVLVRAEHAKHHHARSVPMPTSLQQALIDHQDSVLVFNSQEISPSRPLLPGTSNQRWTTRWIQQFLDNIAFEALKLHVTPMILRHTFATRLLPHANLRCIQMALGHRHLGTTEIYTHPNMNELAAAVQEASELEPTRKPRREKPPQLTQEPRNEPNPPSALD